MSDLRFLADESCDFVVVRSLRAKGYDVLAVGEYMQRSVDSELIERAHRENRILLTEDKDFGWLVFASHSVSAGVVLIRFPNNLRSTLGQSVMQLRRHVAFTKFTKRLRDYSRRRFIINVSCGTTSAR